MNNIEIYADGGTFGKSGSGFSVILLSLNHIWKRSFATGNFTTNMASLLAAKFGLLSISKSNKLPINLYVRNKYVRDMIEKDKDGFYKRTPSSNKDAVDELRSLINDLNVVVNTADNKYTKECKELINKAVKEGEPTDYRK